MARSKTSRQLNVKNFVQQIAKKHEAAQFEVGSWYDAEMLSRLGGCIIENCAPDPGAEEEKQSAPLPGLVFRSWRKKFFKPPLLM